MSETDISNETQNSRSSTDSAEEKLRNRLYELAMKMSEKETSSGEDQESESKTELKNQKGSLSSEENSQGVQEELKKVRGRTLLQTVTPIAAAGGADTPWAPESFPLNAQPKYLGEEERTFSVIAKDNQGRDLTVLGHSPIMSPVVSRL